MLHDEKGLPLFYPTLFATTHLRNAGAAVNTIRNKLADIAVLLRWERDHGRDVLDELRRGQVITMADIVSIRDYASLDMRGLLEAGAPRRCRSDAVGLLEARIESSVAARTVSGQQHYNRLSTIAEYLEFTATVITQHRNSVALSEDIRRMAVVMRKHRPRGLAKQLSDDADLRSPPSDLVQRFMAAASEGHPCNPFRSPDVQLRNAIVFGLLRHTGIRRGELLSLRIDQIDFGSEATIWVRRNHDDRHDSRRYQPVAKTKERPLPIPEGLAAQIQRYVMQVRARITPARRHPYLLVSHHKGRTWGHPLSVSALSSRIFPRMYSVDPEFKEIHPHAFRHHFNYELSLAVDEHNAKARSRGATSGADLITEAKELDVRAFLNGHRSKNSGAGYNRRHIREASDAAARQLQIAIMRQRNSKDGS